MSELAHDLIWREEVEEFLEAEEEWAEILAEAMEDQSPILDSAPPKAARRKRMRRILDGREKRYASLPEDEKAAIQPWQVYKFNSLKTPRSDRVGSRHDGMVGNNGRFDVLGKVIEQINLDELGVPEIPEAVDKAPVRGYSQPAYQHLEQRRREDLLDLAAQ